MLAQDPAAPAEIPSYALISPEQFVSWLCYSTVWEPVMPAFVACPLCGASVLDGLLRMKHCIWHAGNLFREN